MASIDISFSRYVAARKGAAAARLREGAAYSYGGDAKVRNTLEKMRPVTLAMEAAVRFWKTVGRNRLLGNAVRVGERQFPALHRLAERAADVLQIRPPNVYVTADPKIPQAQTFGTAEDATILINGALMDRLTEPELLWTLGYECGHVQNGHTVYLTTLYFLGNAGNMFVRWGTRPAVLALNAWARRADITCDRAGLLCARDLDVSVTALVKLALGSRQLFSELNMEDYLKQLAEGQAGPSRFAELFTNHPYLPKRVEALRLFAKTTYYVSVMSGFAATPGDGAGATGSEGSMTKDECDAQVGELLAVF